MVNVIIAYQLHFIYIAVHFVQNMCVLCCSNYIFYHIWSQVFKRILFFLLCNADNINVNSKRCDKNMLNCRLKTKHSMKAIRWHSRFIHGLVETKQYSTFSFILFNRLWLTKNGKYILCRYLDKLLKLEESMLQLLLLIWYFYIFICIFDWTTRLIFQQFTTIFA